MLPQASQNAEIDAIRNKYNSNQGGVPFSLKINDQDVSSFLSHDYQAFFLNHFECMDSISFSNILNHLPMPCTNMEQFIDECQFEIQRKVANEGYYLRPRFSPGYGDFSIEHQKQILQMLNAAKEIGVSSTESSMLTPTKSVTALIGLSKSNQKCHPSGCEACQKYDCIYRRC